MNIKSIKTNENDAMKRKDGIAFIEFESTINLNQATDLIIKKLALENKDLLKILKLETKFGKHLAEVSFEVYDDAKLMKTVEVLAKKTRDTLKSEAKKAFEEKKKAKEEAAAKAKEESEAKAKEELKAKEEAKE